MSIVTVGIDRARMSSPARRPRAPRRGARQAARTGGRAGAVRDRHGGLLGRASLARLFAAHGHTVRLMAPKFVVPYRLSGKRGKNDAADAAAVCEAVQHPNMRCVPLESCEQQSQLMLHRARQGFVEARTATLNRIRGLLSEFGVVLPLKAEVVRRQAAGRLEDLPGYANTVIGDLLSEVHHLDERIAQ